MLSWGKPFSERKHSISYFQRFVAEGKFSAFGFSSVCVFPTWIRVNWIVFHVPRVILYYSVLKRVKSNYLEYDLWDRKTSFLCRVDQTSYDTCWSCEYLLNMASSWNHTQITWLWVVTVFAKGKIVSNNMEKTHKYSLLGTCLETCSMKWFGYKYPWAKLENLTECWSVKKDPFWMWGDSSFLSGTL